MLPILLAGNHHKYVWSLVQFIVRYYDTLEKHGADAGLSLLRDQFMNWLGLLARGDDTDHVNEALNKMAVGFMGQGEHTPQLLQRTAQLMNHVLLLDNINGTALKRTHGHPHSEIPKANVLTLFEGIEGFKFCADKSDSVISLQRDLSSLAAWKYKIDYYLLEIKLDEANRTEKLNMALADNLIDEIIAQSAVVEEEEEVENFADDA